MSRRERFRQYMTRVAAAAEPSLVINQGLYVPPPNAVSDVVVRHLEIEPASRHLVVGTIGSGKTTQLLVATDLLNALPDMCATYIDVSRKQDLVKLRPGCLVALAGMALLDSMERDRLASSLSPNWFRHWAVGYTRDSRDEDYENDDDSVQVDGVVTPPQPDWHEINANQVEQLAELAAAMRASGRHFVVLLDSLDRTTNRAAFTQLVDQDIAALRRCQIGVVLIGPIRSLEGFGRLELDRFDKLHLQGPVDVAQDDAGKDFMFQVLRARVDNVMLADREALAIVAASGGVLRDLISLAKAAGEEAYLHGADVIAMAHVEAAIDTFGRSMMVGLHKAEVDTLKHLRDGGGFVWTTDDDLSLLATRRVLEYPRRQEQFSVHPTIVPLLDQKAG
jgi:energy-coupling factor transporter ATP-binding protein EcfA2